MNPPETNIDVLHIRMSIKRIGQSIDELEKTQAFLASMLPKKSVSPKNIIIELSNGRLIDALGREVKNGS